MAFTTPSYRTYTTVSNEPCLPWPNLEWQHEDIVEWKELVTQECEGELVDCSMCFMMCLVSNTIEKIY